MTNSSPAALAHDLEAAVQGVPAEWFDFVERTSFVDGQDTKLRQQLAATVEKIVELLATEPFPQREAGRLGVGLSQIRCVRADVLGRMLDELARRLVSALSAEVFIAIQPQLYAITTGIMAGFIQDEAARVSREQHAIHQALLTARRQSEIARQASEDRYHAVIAQVTEGIVLADAQSGRVLETNAAFQQLLGYTPLESAALFLHQLVAHDRTSVDHNIREALRKGRHDVNERRCIRKDGTQILIDASITAVKTANGTLLCAVIRDVTERARAASDLAATRRALAESREAERVRLARELHDGALQELVGAHLQLSAAAGDAARGRSLVELAPEFRHINEQLASITRQLRWAVGELRPGGLDTDGLPAALEHYVTQLRAMTANAPAVALRLDPRTRDLPRPAALCLFRTGQEALRNAFLHAQAHKVDVRLRVRDRAVILRVSDNGRGFVVPEQLSMLARRNHFGLAGIAERVEWADGRLRVRSRPTRGTTVTVWMPLQTGRTGDGKADPAPARG